LSSIFLSCSSIMDAQILKLTNMGGLPLYRCRPSSTLPPFSPPSSEDAPRRRRRGGGGGGGGEFSLFFSVDFFFFFLQGPIQVILPRSCRAFALIDHQFQLAADQSRCSPVFGPQCARSRAYRSRPNLFHWSR
jgi:hypothetical protein